ncbi:hypothetical protein CSKR_112101 [Clonorchis sinensis]|uniref:Uncharacterized protein n=1 Tax=Clonorchis sinensis TaxID=79923 RepID=A0A3R7FJV1_CLOSI|nr:hypothetical protein CSKR_112101 [Clonorchis sinensis]
MYGLTPNPSTLEGKSPETTLLHRPPPGTFDLLKSPKEEVASSNCLFTTHSDIECVPSEYFDVISGYEQSKDSRHPSCVASTRGANVSIITKNDTQKDASEEDSS